MIHEKIKRVLTRKCTGLRSLIFNLKNYKLIFIRRFVPLCDLERQLIIHVYSSPFASWAAATENTTDSIINLRGTYLAKVPNTF